MAKKTSRNAVKKIDSQIDMIDADSKKKSDDDITMNKTELKRRVSRSTGTGTKKSTPSRSSKTVKKTTPKSGSKSSSSRSTTVKPSVKKEDSVRENIVVTPVKKTVKKENETKSIRGEVVVAPEKKSKTTSVKKTPAKKNVRGEVVIAPAKKRKSTANKIVNKVDPKQLDENVQNIIKDIEKQEAKSEKIEKDVTTTEVKVDNAVVEEPKKPEVSYDDWKLDKPIDLDNIDKYESNSIIDEFEADIFKMRESAVKKSKKKNKYIINYHEKKVSSYSELEKDLRSLYDKVNDVVKDFSEYKKPYKSKNAKDNLEVEEDPFDNSPSVLDFINQKVLNVFLILLSVIFIVMCIAFVWFIIFVSTF